MGTHESRRLTSVKTAFSRDFKKKGMIPLSTYLKQYRVGDIVDVVANGAVQKGMREYIPTSIFVLADEVLRDDGNPSFWDHMLMDSQLTRSTMARPASSTT